MEETVQGRLIQFIEYKGLNNSTFEKSIGVANAYVSKIRKSIGSVVLNKILNVYPELSRDWLIYGEGSMLVSDQAELSAPDPGEEASAVALLRDIIREKDAAIETLNRRIGRLEAENDALRASAETPEPDASRPASAV